MFLESEENDKKNCSKSNKKKISYLLKQIQEEEEENPLLK